MLYGLQVAREEVDGRLKLATPSERDTIAKPGTTVYLSPIDGRAYVLLKSKVSDQVTFRQFGMPTLLVTWRGSNEDN